MLLNDNAIRDLCVAGMIAPFKVGQVREVEDSFGARKVVSYGVSSFGYDIRLATGSVRLFSPCLAREIDPKAFDDDSLIELPLYHSDDGSRYYLIPPHSYALGVTIEVFQMPADVLGVCVGKSTYARCGLVVNTTPLEPGWRGRLVVELANTASLPVRVYAGEGIAQCLFFRGDAPTTNYADRKGKYQNQMGLATAMV